MAIQNGFFKSINGDRRYLAEFFTSYFASFIGNGVFPNPSTNLQVINNQNFSTVVRPGKGWINGHYLNNDDNIVINHQPPDGVLRRIDRIVFSVNLDSRSMDIYLKQGTPSSSSVAPALVRNSTLYELALADISFNPGMVSISQSNITDQRMNKALCGIVHGVVEQLDTTTLFNQYQQFLVDKGVEFDQQLAVNQQVFDDWFAQLNDILDGDVAANLANMIVTHANNATPQKHIEVVTAMPQNLSNKGLLLLVDDVDNPDNPPEIPTSIVLSNRIDSTNQNLQSTKTELENKKSDKTYVDAQLSQKANQSFVDAQLASIVSGAPKGTFTDFAALQETYPNGAEGIFLVLSNGHWYYWNSELLEWIDGGVYQATEIPDESITPRKVTFIKPSENLFDKNTVTANKTISGINGTLLDNQGTSVSDFIMAKPETPYVFRYINRRAFYRADKTFISSVLPTDNSYFITPADTAYIRMVVSNANVNTAQLNEGMTLLPFEPYENQLRDVVIDWDDVKNKNIPTERPGDLAIITLNTTTKYPAIDIYNKKVIFYSGTHISHQKQRYTLQNDIEVNISASATIQHVMFDVSSQTFRFLTGANITATRDTEIMLMTIVFRTISPTRGDLKSVFCSSPYDVLTEYDYLVSKVDKNYKFKSVDLVGTYTSLQTSHDAFDYDPNITSAEFYINAMRDLLNGYDHITETYYGLDSSGTYPIYRYDIKPEQVAITGLTQQRNVPKITLANGIHGGEKSTLFALYYFLKDMLENWDNSALLEYLRFNVDISFISCANPWGFDRNTRKNSNGVDINRNFSSNFVVLDPNDSDYGGLAPFDQVETQYIKNLIDTNRDSFVFCDLHTNGSSGEDYRTLIWCSLSDGILLVDKIAEMAKYHISQMTNHYQVEYGEPSGVGFYGYISFGSRPTSQRYANTMGIDACTFEGFRKFPNDTVYHNERAIKANVDNIGNWIINMVLAYK